MSVLGAVDVGGRSAAGCLYPDDGGAPDAYEMTQPLSSGRERELRVGERVSLGGRVGVLQYFWGTGAAVVRLDQEVSTKVVPLRRLVGSPEAAACLSPSMRAER